MTDAANAVWLDLATLVVDMSLSVRDELDRPTVTAYEESFTDLPPVEVYELPDGRLLLVDGFHRVAAARNRRETRVWAIVKHGGWAEAAEEAVLANLRHGRPYTLPERRRAANRLVRAHPDWADHRIAQLVGTSAHTVRRERAVLENAQSIPVVTDTEGADGRVRPRSYQKSVSTGAADGGNGHSGTAAALALPAPVALRAPLAAADLPLGAPPLAATSVVVAQNGIATTVPWTALLPPAPYWRAEVGGVTVVLYQGNCLDILPDLPDYSVDLIFTDPPQFRVKTEEDWDCQWATPAEYLAWLAQLCGAWQRVLKPNGSIYVTAGHDLSDLVAVTMRRYFRVLNRIRWEKEDGWHKKTARDALQSYLSPWEELIFAEQYNDIDPTYYGLPALPRGGFLYEPLREYLDGERRRAGVDLDTIRAAVGCAPGSGLPGHWFSTVQWYLPTAEQYVILRQLFYAQGRQPPPPYAEYHPHGDYWQPPSATEHGAPYLEVDYAYLQADYDALRRPFAVGADRPATDLWRYAPVTYFPGKHPCAKPPALVRDALLTSSRAGAVVLDCFMGGGATVTECVSAGRHVIGIDLSRHWCAETQRAVENLATTAPAPVVLGAQ